MKSVAQDAKEKELREQKIIDEQNAKMKEAIMQK